jgi:hypothetical protein
MDKDGKQGKTVVTFRIFPDGDVIALFPGRPAGTPSHPRLVSSYMRVGQHGGADFQVVTGRTRLARPVEFASLKRELESLGYDLIVKERISRRMLDAVDGREPDRSAPWVVSTREDDGRVASIVWRRLTFMHAGRRHDHHEFVLDEGGMIRRFADEGEARAVADALNAPAGEKAVAA